MNEHLWGVVFAALGIAIGALWKTLQRYNSELDNVRAELERLRDLVTEMLQRMTRLEAKLNNGRVTK